MSAWRRDDPREVYSYARGMTRVVVALDGALFGAWVNTTEDSWTVWLDPNPSDRDAVRADDSWPGWRWYPVPMTEWP